MPSPPRGHLAKSLIVCVERDFVWLGKRSKQLMGDFAKKHGLVSELGLNVQSRGWPPDISPLLPPVRPMRDRGGQRGDAISLQWSLLVRASCMPR